ncbi:MAG: hypothetical protein HQL72_04265 [Magnetococcales bacterium]|nr:hypothetical protein [Magnetococcales bacterium]
MNCSNPISNHIRSASKKVAETVVLFPTPPRPFSLNPRTKQLTDTTVHFLVQASNQLESARKKARNTPLAEEITLASDSLQNAMTAYGISLAGREV